MGVFKEKQVPISEPGNTKHREIIREMIETDNDGETGSHWARDSHETTNLDKVGDINSIKPPISVVRGFPGGGRARITVN